MREDAQLRQVLLVKDGGGWRPPRVNETCCVRPRLASLLDDVALSGPDALYSTRKAEVMVPPPSHSFDRH